MQPSTPGQPDHAPTRFCLRCGYALLESMTGPACPECGNAFDPTKPTTTSPSPRRLRRFWRRRSRPTRLAIIFLVIAMPLAVGLMEYRHQRIRQIESTTGHYGIYFDWSWTQDSDPTFYGQCVDLEWWLWNQGELGRFTARNLERIRRRLRTNFSPIQSAWIYDQNAIYLSNEHEFELAIRAMHLAHSRGVTEITWEDYGWARHSSEPLPLESKAERDDDIGKRAQDILELADRLDIEIK